MKNAGGKMQHQYSQGGVYVSRRAFKELVMLWLTIVFFTFTGAIILTIGKAHAQIVLSIPLLTRVSEPAIIKSFKVSPPSAKVGTQCHKLLTPISNGQAVVQSDRRSRRAAGDLATASTILTTSSRNCSGREDEESSMKTSMR